MAFGAIFRSKIMRFNSVAFAFGLFPLTLGSSFLPGPVAGLAAGLVGDALTGVALVGVALATGLAELGEVFFAGGCFALGAGFLIGSFFFVAIKIIS